MACPRKVSSTTESSTVSLGASPVKDMNQEPLIISVVLCTFNRAGMLFGVLESLADQSLNSAHYEIVVVNNASTDKTDEVVRSFQNAHPNLAILILTEPKQGLGHARNAGWRQGCGSHVVFLDDDCLAPRNWLEAIMHAFRSVAPEPWSVGGPIVPIYDDPKPSWFRDEYELWTWGKHERLLRHGETFFGGNMAFRKSILEEYGGFDTRIGMSGAYLSTGEETALFQRMWGRGGSACVFYYSPKAAMCHRVSRARMRLSYLLKRAFAEGQASYTLSAPPTWFCRVRGFLRATAAWFWHCSRALTFIRSSPWQCLVAGAGRVIAFQTGYVAGYLGLFFKMKVASR
jgi:glucosyl-dolichyl phosphate glucuronosyltransferase